MSILGIDEGMRSATDPNALAQFRQQIPPANARAIHLITTLSQACANMGQLYVRSIGAPPEADEEGPNFSIALQMLHAFKEDVEDDVLVSRSNLDGDADAFGSFVAAVAQRAGFTIQPDQIGPCALEPIESIRGRIATMTGAREDQLQQFFPNIATRHWDMISLRNAKLDWLARFNAILTRIQQDLATGGQRLLQTVEDVERARAARPAAPAAPAQPQALWRTVGQVIVVILVIVVFVVVGVTA
jgi:hypothetical protein